MKIQRLGRAEASGEAGALMELATGLAGAPQWGRAVWDGMIAGLDERGGRAGRMLFGAFDGGRLAGFAVCAHAADEAEIESIAVSESVQRQGVGRALLEVAMDELRRAGVGVAHLEVRAGNTKAIHFYVALGFVEQGRRAGYYRGPVEDAVLMNRGLNQ